MGSGPGHGDTPPSLQSGSATSVPPLVSIIVTCFEQADLVGEAVSSARSQTHPRVEVVVVDDGSTDASAQVAAEAHADRVLQQRNTGVSGARQSGLAAATGEYVVFLDGDDRLHPRAVEVQLSYLQAAPGAAFAAGRNRLVDGDGRPLATPVEPPHTGDLYEELLRRPWICPPSAVLVRRAALEDVGGWNPDLLVGEDLDVYLRLARSFPGVDHPEVVTDYRIHTRMHSRSYRVNLEANLHVLARHASEGSAEPRLREAREAGERYFTRMLAPKIVLTELATALRTGRGVLPAFGGFLALLREDAPGVSRLVRDRLRRRRTRSAG